MMYLSSQTAITKYHRLCKFNNRNFPQFQKLRSPRLRCQLIWFLVRALVLAGRWSLLFTRQKAFQWFFPLLTRVSALSNQGLTLRTSFNLYHHLRGPNSKQSHIRVRMSTYEFKGTLNIQSITNGKELLPSGEKKKRHSEGGLEVETGPTCLGGINML